MPLSGCTNGLVVTALVTLLLLPAQYYIPDLYLSPKEHISESLSLSSVTDSDNFTEPWFSLDFNILDLFLTLSLLSLAFFIYLCDWIQRKLMERRIIKLNHYLCECLEKLRGWDARQEKLETTLRMVQNATSEYNLLLLLVMRRQRLAPARPSSCDKDLEDFNMNFDTNPALYRAAAL
ncbi:uncharacterized protein LOC116771872 [Danaus plexippus]|uniref:Uncharacterized protein n=1 Tax=Danaus plexippus plexippus TaxID=278856 RepID=A0A212EJV3_DANPL|nr:uncharacterized protein LOC116771872 [Danaus plexippus]OWR41792.1 hypothetical protein KGM_209895 [Danaus plexippus plexippus]